MGELHPVSNAQLKGERRIKELLASRQIVTDDRTDFENLCEKFRETCKEVRTLVDWPTFRGSFEECLAATEMPVLQGLPKFQAIYNKLNILDRACRHEGEKLGYRLAEWWLYCWKDELNEEAQKTEVTR